MARYSNISLAVFILAIVAVWHYRLWIIGILCILLALKLIAFMARFCRTARTADIDSMNGLDFEHYVADLLSKHGFSNVSLTEQYDLGVDIVAEKNGVRWGIQVKRYSGLVKAAAVRQVVTALRFYDCDRAMVITNSTYSKVARRLADSNDCVLIDRPKLLKLIG